MRLKRGLCRIEPRRRFAICAAAASDRALRQTRRLPAEVPAGERLPASRAARTASTTRSARKRSASSATIWTTSRRMFSISTIRSVMATAQISRSSGVRCAGRPEHSAPARGRRAGCRYGPHRPRSGRKPAENRQKARRPASAAGGNIRRQIASDLAQVLIGRCGSCPAAMRRRARWSAPPSPPAHTAICLQKHTPVVTNTAAEAQSGVGRKERRAERPRAIARDAPAPFPFRTGLPGSEPDQTRCGARGGCFPPARRPNARPRPCLWQYHDRHWFSLTSARRVRRCGWKAPPPIAPSGCVARRVGRAREIAAHAAGHGVPFHFDLCPIH